MSAGRRHRGILAGTRGRLRFLPVVERELRAAARRPITHLGRFLSAVLAMALGGYFYWFMVEETQVRLGQIIFMTSAWLAFLSCLFAGVRHTSACITSERRAGTLGLLFLTSLRGYDIVLGKLVASSISALQALLAILPVIAVPVLMGGIGAADLGRVAGLLLATLLFSLALGMFASLWGDSDRRAAMVTTLVLLVLTIGPWLWVARWAGRTPSTPRDYAVLLASPAYSLAAATSGLMGRTPSGPHYGWGVGVLAAGGAVLLVGCSLILPRLYRDRVVAARATGWAGFWRRVNEGSEASRRAFRAALLTVNPFLWLAARRRRDPAWVWAFVAISTGGWFGVLALWPELWEEMATARYFVLSLFLHLALRVWIGLAATKRLAEDRRAGTLELLLSTPLSVPEILRGQVQALGRQFGGPVGAVLVLDVLFCWATLREVVIDRDLALLVYVARGLMLVTDAYALAWYGMWRGLTARSASEATSSTVFAVLAVPWMVLIGLVSVVRLTGLGGQWNWEMSDRLVLFIWYIVGLGVDVGLWVMASGRLHADFRVEVSERRPAHLFWRLLGSATARARFAVSARKSRPVRGPKA